MSNTIGELFNKFSDSSAPKSIVLSILFAGIGFVTKQAVEQYRVDNTLEDHTKKITAILENQDTTHRDLNAVAVTIATVDGKLDVLSAKIDDDRRDRVRWQDRQPAKTTRNYPR